MLMKLLQCLLCFLLKRGGRNARLFITLHIMPLPVFQYDPKTGSLF